MPPLSTLLFCGPSMCWAAGPAGSSLFFHIIDNRPAQGMEEWNGRANATLPLQLLLAATATGAENQTHCFVIISDGLWFPISPTLCVSLPAFFYVCHFVCVLILSFSGMILHWNLFVLFLTFQPLKHLRCCLCLHVHVCANIRAPRHRESSSPWNFH